MDGQQEPLTHDETRRLNAECKGAPKYFRYPAELPYTEEERQRY